MDYMKTLRKILETAPSREARVASATRVIQIAKPGTMVCEFFGRKADVVLYYDEISKILFDDSGKEFTKDSVDASASKCLFIITHHQARAITKKLRQYGIQTVMDLTQLHWKTIRLLDADFILAHLGKIERLFEKIDTQSAEILLCLLLFHIRYDPDILKFSNYPSYFHKNILLQLEHEIIIDGGAFTGDSAFLFLNATQGAAQIFSFEPDIDNYNTLLRNILHNKASSHIHALPYGLWDSKSTLHFLSAQHTSRIVEHGDNFINTVSIDWFCQFFHINPTWIKLDVEGAEMQALRGASNTIQKNKPKLCISLYHCAGDLWELPDFIMSLRDDYVFHIGHHSVDKTIYDTILYAY